MINPIFEMVSKNKKYEKSDDSRSFLRYFTDIPGKYYERGENLNESDLINSIVFVEEGKVSIFNNKHQEIRYQEQFIYAGEFANLETAFNKQAYKNCNLRVETAAVIKKISFEIFNRLLQKSQFNQIILQLLADQARGNQKRVNRLRFMSSRYRILNYLWELAINEGTRVGYEVVIDFPPTQLEIAVSVSTARQTVTSFLLELRRDNIIHYNRRCFIFRDLEKLKVLLDASY